MKSSCTAHLWFVFEDRVKTGKLHSSPGPSLYKQNSRFLNIGEVVFFSAPTPPPPREISDEGKEIKRIDELFKESWKVRIYVTFNYYSLSWRGFTALQVTLPIIVNSAWSQVLEINKICWHFATKINYEI